MAYTHVVVVVHTGKTEHHLVGSLHEAQQYNLTTEDMYAVTEVLQCSVHCIIRSSIDNILDADFVQWLDGFNPTSLLFVALNKPADKVFELKRDADEYIGNKYDWTILHYLKHFDNTSRGVVHEQD